MDIKIFTALIILFPLLLNAAESTFTFKLHGKNIKDSTLGDLSKLSPVQELEVFNPDTNGTIKFKAYSVQDLLDKVIGPKWRDAEEIRFTCSDGYQPNVPVEQFKKYKAYLAFERADQKEFSLIDQNENNKKVDLGPLYLIWDNEKVSEIRNRDGTFWPFKLVSLDLTTFQEQFPKISPVGQISASAKRGFLVFQKVCLNCHSINGQGGSTGPELNYPLNVTEYWSSKFLRKWILNPADVRLRTTMPPLSTFTKSPESATDDVISYLNAIKGNKIKP